MIPKMKKKTLMISAGTWEMSESKDCRNIIYVYVCMYVFLRKRTRVQMDRGLQTDMDSENLLDNGRLPARNKSITYATQFIDFDDLLPQIGEFGQFQKLMFLFMIPFCFIAPFAYLSQIFMTLNPSNYYCFVPELSLIESSEERKNLSVPLEADGSYSHCRIYDRNYSMIYKSADRSQYMKHNASEPTIACQEGYVYDQDLSFLTASIEFGWVCDREGYATYAQMIFFAGSIVGCLGYGHFADNAGRLAALVSSCALALFGSFCTGLSKSYFAFLISRFMVGASYDTCFTMIYILGRQIDPSWNFLMFDQIHMYVIPQCLSMWVPPIEPWWPTCPWPYSIHPAPCWYLGWPTAWGIGVPSLLSEQCPFYWGCARTVCCPSRHVGWSQWARLMMPSIYCRL